MKTNFPVVRLGDHVRQISQRNKGKTGAEVFSVTNSEGFTRSTDYFSKEVFSKNISNYKVVRKGQFAYNPSRINVGSIDYLRPVERVLVSPLYIVFETDSELHADYLLRYMKGDWGNAQISANTEGAVRDSLKYKGLENIKIPLPLLDDQKRITYLLGKVEGLITRRKQHLQQLDDLLKSVFLEMFGDPVRNEKGWKIEPLAILIAHQPNNGLYKPQSSYGTGTKIIRIDSFYNGYVQNLDKLKRVEITNAEYEKYRIETDDILINRVNSMEYLGKIGVVPEIDEPMVYESNMMRFRVNRQSILPIFLMFVWRLPFVKAQITNRAKKAVNQASINQKDVLSFLVPKPPLPLQKQFATIVEKVESLKSRYQQSLTDLEAFYGALSQKAFKGELDLSRVVVTMDKEEPAEAMEPITTDLTEPQPIIELPAPESVGSFFSAKGRNALISQWLEVYLDQLGSVPFSAQHFIETAQQRLMELLEELEEPESLTTDYDFFQFGPIEYDHVKDLIFKAVASGRLTQTFDEARNRVHLTMAKG